MFLTKCIFINVQFFFYKNRLDYGRLCDAERDAVVISKTVQNQVDTFSTNVFNCNSVVINCSPQKYLYGMFLNVSSCGLKHADDAVHVAVSLHLGCSVLIFLSQSRSRLWAHWIHQHLIFSENWVGS